MKLENDGWLELPKFTKTIPIYKIKYKYYVRLDDYKKLEKKLAQQKSELSEEITDLPVRALEINELKQNNFGKIFSKGWNDCRKQVINLLNKKDE